LATRLAEQGHRAVAIDYFGRTAGANYRDRDESFEVGVHQAKLTRPGLQDDLVAGMAHLRTDCASVVVLGFCMGGRLAFFASAPRFGASGVIGFYGVPGTAGPYGPGPTQHAAELAAPILGLFGEADEGIPLSDVAAFDAALAAAGVAHEIVTYPGVGHGFFDVHHNENAASARSELASPAVASDQNAAACIDAWRRVLAFLDACRVPRAS
jgi:carboxymethylenebutenolidase